MSLVDRVTAILESIADKRTAAEVVITFIQAATRAEMMAAQQEAEERAREAERRAEQERAEQTIERRRQKAAERQRRHRGSRPVTRDNRDEALLGVTERDGVSPTPPSPSSPSGSLSVPDPERAIPVPGLGAFPVDGGRTWVVTAWLLEKHQAAFPEIDVLAEYRKCQVYLVGNPAKRKPSEEMPTALFRWLTIAQERGTGVKRAATKERPASAKPSGLESYCDWHKDARNDGKPNQFRPKADCPSCKHLKAAARPREENTQIALGGNR